MSVAAVRDLEGQAAVRPAAVAPNLLRRLSTSGLAWGTLASVALAVWIGFVLGGAHYYLTPLAVRAYEPLHRLLRPSGPIGQTLGVAGTLLLLMPFLYMARKRVRGLRSAGTLGTWLEVHLFCGILGPVLVTFHTSFKFNGIISAAYWSMVLVMLSGFVGRYLYVRIPRSLRGHELTRAELDAQAEQLKDDLARSIDSHETLRRIEAFERAAVPAEEELSTLDLLFGDVAFGRKLRALDAELERGNLSAEHRAEILRLTTERALLLRRTAYLRRTKWLFDLWHVFHLPLVYLLLVIAAVHIGVALFLGYVPFRW
jgi:hypothetical protein